MNTDHVSDLCSSVHVVVVVLVIADVAADADARTDADVAADTDPMALLRSLCAAIFVKFSDSCRYACSLQDGIMYLLGGRSAEALKMGRSKIRRLHIAFGGSTHPIHKRRQRLAKGFHFIRRFASLRMTLGDFWFKSRNGTPPTQSMMSLECNTAKKLKMTSLMFYSLRMLARNH